MDFRLNEEQQMLQDTVAHLVLGEYSFEKRLEYSESWYYWPLSCVT